MLYQQRNLFLQIEILLFALFFVISIALPFIILYVLFLFDNKIRSREDFEKFSLNLVGEIPFFESDNEERKVFSKPDDRSIIAESFRILMSNCKYFLNDSSSNVILVTSSVKGEGKTLKCP